MFSYKNQLNYLYLIIHRFPSSQVYDELNGNGVHNLLLNLSEKGVNRV